MVKLSGLVGKRLKLRVKWQDEEVNITYKPFTQAQLNDLTKVEDNDDDENAKRGTAGLICDSVIEWDITDDDGAMLPLTIDNLLILPMPLLNAMTGAMGQDGLPGKRR